MEEYFIWEKIFETKNDIELKELLSLVIVNDDARDLVFKKMLYYKNIPNEMVDITINIDESLKGFPMELLMKKISNDIIEQLRKKEIL